MHEASFTNLTGEAGKTYRFGARISYQSVGNATVMSLDLDSINPDEGQNLVAFNPLSTSHPRK